MKLNFKKNRTLKSGLPQMSNTLTGWEVPLTLTKITQKIVDGDRITEEQQINFQGVFQPLKDEQLQFKPEGQRSWKYYWIHTNSNLPFQTADKIIFKDKRYKITDIKDYDLNGFKELEVILDYQ